MENQFNRAKARLRKKLYIGFIHSLPTYIISPPRMEMMLYVCRYAPLSDRRPWLQYLREDNAHPEIVRISANQERRSSAIVSVNADPRLWISTVAFLRRYITRPSCQQWFPKVRDGPSSLEAPLPGRARMGESCYACRRYVCRYA